MEIYYINSKGIKIDLVKWPYMIQTGDFFDYSWSYSATQFKKGGRIPAFTRGVTEKSTTLTVSARSKAEYYNALNFFHGATEIDVLTLSPGKLYVNGSYMLCYITSANKAEWESGIEQLDMEIKIASEYPFWCRDIDFIFYSGSSNSSTYEFLDYPYTYLFDYSPNAVLHVLNNTNYTGSGFTMRFYGPCVNPSVTINNLVYGARVTLGNGSYLLIDSRKRKIEAVTALGVRENVFNLRRKNNRIFAEIEPGNHTVIKNGNFDVSVTLHQERSEPEWIL